MAVTTKKPSTTRTRKPVARKLAAVEHDGTVAAKYAKFPSGWRAYLAALELRASRILAMGIPGTGKTKAANEVGLKPNEEAYNIYVGDETAAYQFVGAPSLKSGNTDFEFGPALWAAVKGTRLVVNEIDHASADALDALIGICDDPESFKITLPNGDVVHAAEGFHVVATMNGQLSDLPDALRDRFEGCAINIAEPHPDAITALPLELRAMARKLTRESCPAAQRISIRQFRGFAELVEKGMPKEIAAECSFQGKARDLLTSFSLATVAEVGGTEEEVN